MVIYTKLLTVPIFLNSLIIIIIIYVFKIDFLSSFGVSKIILLLTVFLALVNTNNNIYYNYSIRCNKYKFMGFSRIVLSGTFPIIAFFLGFFYGVNVEYLIIAQIIAYFFSSLLLRVGINKNLESSHSDLPFMTLLKKYSDFPKYTSLQSIFDSVVNISFLSLITLFYGNYYAGLYSIVLRFFKAPLGLIGASLSQTYNKHIVDYINNLEFEMVLSSFKKIIGILTLFSMIIFSILFFSSEWLFTVFLGDEWKEAADVSKILIFWLAINFIGSPLTGLFQVINKQKISFIFSYMQNTILLLAIFISAFLNINFDAYIYIYTFINVINNITLIFVLYYFLKRLPSDYFIQNT